MEQQHKPTASLRSIQQEPQEKWKEFTEPLIEEVRSKYITAMGGDPKHDRVTMGVVIIFTQDFIESNTHASRPIATMSLGSGISVMRECLKVMENLMSSFLKSKAKTIQ